MLVFRQDGANDAPSKTKLLILGRSGCGKDALRRELEMRGVRFVKSYTTRPRRTSTEDTHIFITSEQASEMLKTHTIVASTEIDGNLYFATADQITQADAYIIDPDGMTELATTMPETTFSVIYIDASDENRKTAAIARADNPKEAKEIFQSRNKSENPRFQNFEMLANELFVDSIDIFPPNIVTFDKFENDFIPATLSNIADAVITSMLTYENIAAMVSLADDERLFDTQATNIALSHIPFALASDATLLGEFVLNTFMISRIYLVPSKSTIATSAHATSTDTAHTTDSANELDR